MIVTIGNTKGGVGKTTLAVQIALSRALAGRDYLMGKDLTAADIQMSFVGEVAGAFGQCETYPNIAAWVSRFQDRPAYRAALAKGGPYNLGPKT